MANNRIPSGPNTPGSQQTPTQQGVKIFIQRDYSEGTAVKFQTRFPQELEGRIDRQTFEATMERLNEHFEMAETADCSTYCEGCLACLTAYFIYICTETHYEKNERIYNPRGVNITDPILRGLRVVEVTILDPPNCQSPTGNSTSSQIRHT
ncbi:Golgin subfamily A member 7 [Eumeta japonica]|uniref:Ras modification protein ERF4 n=1 Tax=Eumeta variegata TaxID=151549 RepID=A0A4C1WJQ4_EUMVA|nr:Golgin subfamily A member 7 [Eumeta japonica]